MITGHVIGAASFEPMLPTAISRSRQFVVIQAQILKCVGAPAEHVGLEFVHCVPSQVLNEAANLLPALPAINLCCASYVEGWTSGRAYHPSAPAFPDHAATQAQLGI